jgi:tetratricopeptide (TPR) repeat protein
MGRVKHMALEETPYKIAIDFYPAGGRTAAKVKNPPPADGKKAGEPRMAAQVKHPAPAAESAKPAASKPQPGKDKAAPAKAQQGKDKAAALKPAPAKDAKAPGQDAARRAQEEKTAAQAKAQAQARATAEAKAAEQAKAVAQAKAAEEAAAASKALPSEEQRLNGLGAEDRRRLQVGELLMQLGDSSGAMPYLEKVAEHKPEHAWTRILLAQLFLAKGDEYRARHLLESLQASSQWKNTVQPILARMSPPDAHGVVPGGEMPEEDLSFYLGVLRQGGGLKAQDLYREPEDSFLSGIFVGALLGLVAFAGAEWRRRKQMDRLVRERILGESSAPSSPEAPFGRSAADMTEVSRRVREELEQVMQAERTEGGASGGRAAEPSFAAVFEAASNAPDPDSLEERIYRLSDQRKSIVEIAEELNLGVDEVRLHLSLREQSGQMTNG